MTYEDFVMRTMRQQRTARTMDEALRTPAYAAAIIKPQPSRFMSFILNWKHNERL